MLHSSDIIISGEEGKGGRTITDGTVSNNQLMHRYKRIPPLLAILGVFGVGGALFGTIYAVQNAEHKGIKVGCIEECQDEEPDYFVLMCEESC